MAQHELEVISPDAVRALLNKGLADRGSGSTRYQADLFTALSRMEAKAPVPVEVKSAELSGYLAGRADHIHHHSRDVQREDLYLNQFLGSQLPVSIQAAIVRGYNRGVSGELNIF